MPFDITAALPEFLKTVKRPGEFYGSGAIELPIVRIEIDGVGRLGLPIPPLQAQQLIALATPAPYGRGAETLVDPNVRKCGQIAPANVHLADARWQAKLNEITAAAANALGVDGEVQAELYKLLVYETGSFFSQHRDTEKAKGMFATLVVVLPSAHRGGDLLVQHDGAQVTLNLASEEVAVARWAAFYSDCQHELRPIASGYRIALIYNLIRPKGLLPHAPDRAPAIEQAASLLQQWIVQGYGPIKLVLPLKHKYTLAEWHFASLKNEDAAAAAVLKGAVAKADATLRLVLLSIHQTGSAEEQYRRSGRSFEGNGEYEVIDINEDSQSLDNWLTPNERSEDLGTLELEDGELAPENALADAKPDEDEFSEATGNEGASFERTYRHAALVIWPNANELQVIAQGGQYASLAAIERWVADPARV